MEWVLFYGELSDFFNIRTGRSSGCVPFNLIITIY